jgi:hypothetical protein
VHLSEYPDQCYRIRRVLKDRLTVNLSHFKKFGKIIENQKKSGRNAADVGKEQKKFGNTKFG